MVAFILASYYVFDIMVLNIWVISFSSFFLFLVNRGISFVIGPVKDLDAFNLHPKKEMIPLIL